MSRPSPSSSTTCDLRDDSSGDRESRHSIWHCLVGRHVHDARRSTAVAVGRADLRNAQHLCQPRAADRLLAVAALQPMPPIHLPVDDLRRFGARWQANGERLSRSRPESSLEFGSFIDSAVGAALARMLGDVPVTRPVSSRALTPPEADCVEVGPVRIVGGVRPQNFDCGYRPDGVRFAFDSKTLNDRESVGKNYQNMINDLATEATTVHSRFPYAVVAFMVVIPAPCLVEPHRSAIIGTLERLGGRRLVDEPIHRAEAMALVLWDPASGEVLPDRPQQDSPIRLERFSEAVEAMYVDRYKGLPPHAEVEEDVEVEGE